MNTRGLLELLSSSVLTYYDRNSNFVQELKRVPARLSRASVTFIHPSALLTRNSVVIRGIKGLIAWHSRCNNGGAVFCVLEDFIMNQSNSARPARSAQGPMLAVFPCLYHPGVICAVHSTALVGAQVGFDSRSRHRSCLLCHARDQRRLVHSSARSPGVFRVPLWRACSQLCGLGHYRMRGHLTVESQDAFEKWLHEAAEEGN
jgi:hypothetical protein